MSRRPRTHGFLSRLALTRDLLVITVAVAAVVIAIGWTGLFEAIDSWLVDLRLNWHTWGYHPDAEGAQSDSPFPDVAVLHFDQDDLMIAGADAQREGMDVTGWHDREQLRWMVRRTLEILADLKQINAAFAPPVIGLDFYNLGEVDEEDEQSIEMAEALATAAGRLGNVVDGYRLHGDTTGEQDTSEERVLPTAAAHGYLDLLSPSERWMDADVSQVVTVGRWEETPGGQHVHVRDSLALAIQRVQVAEEMEISPDDPRLIDRLLLEGPLFAESLAERANPRLQLHLLFLPPRASLSTAAGLAPARSSFPVIHFRDLIALSTILKDGRNPALWPRLGVVYGKPLLVGVDLPDVDRIRTPYSNRLYASQEYPGVEVHAQILYNLINGIGLRPLHRARPLLSGAILVLLMFASAFCAGRLSLITSIMAASITLAIMAAIDAWLWKTNLVWLPLSQWVTGIAMANRSAAQLLARREHRARALVTRRLEQHVTEKVAHHLIHNPDAGNLGGHRQSVTVLFSDLQGFTTMTEQLPAEQMLQIMNRYLDAMSREIAEEGGTLANYIGDAIFAIFGAPMALEDHATHGVRAAIRMQRALQRFNEESAAEGRPALAQRIGLSSGEVLIGNVGGSDRFIWTAMGDAVPIGARLEPMNKKYGTSILMSHVTHDLIGEGFSTRLVDSGIQVRGREGLIDIYTVDIG